MRRITGLAFVLAVALAACSGGGGEKEGEGEKKGECGSPPASQGSAATKLPDNFPTPDGVTYTGASVAGPSTVVIGYFDGDLDEAYEGYQDDFNSAGYDVTDSEKEADDAEVNFSGGNTTGQVKMIESCDGRVDLTITARPA